MAKVDDFYISDNRREEMIGIADLARSIDANGLLQPILVKRTDKGFDILAGRRRFTAIKEVLGWKELRNGDHYKIIDEVDDLIVQLEENSHRKDFSPIALASLVNDIHTKKIEEHGRAVQGVKVGWSINDTAKLIGRDKSFVSRALLIWQHRDLVRNCLSVKEALDKIKSHKEKKIVKELRKEKVKKAIVAPDINSYFDAVENTDAVTFLKSLSDKSIDFIFTDPPFGISYDEYVKSDDYDKYDDDPDEILSLLNDCISEFFRVLKNNKYVVLWVGFPHMQRLSNMFADAGFSISPSPLAWVKMGVGGKTMRPDRFLGNVLQLAIVAYKGDPQLNKPGRNNVFPYNVVRKNRVHIAQMPHDLCADVIDVFTSPGDLVLDVFAGSLSTLRGCYATKRRFIGCELSKDNIDNGKAYTIDWLETAQKATK